jgi:hypothetical protein
MHPLKYPGEQRDPKFNVKRKQERSNQVQALWGTHVQPEQVSTASLEEKGLSKKQMPVGKPSDRLTWIRHVGR